MRASGTQGFLLYLLCAHTDCIEKLNVFMLKWAVLSALTWEGNNTSQLWCIIPSYPFTNYRACLLESKDLMDLFLWLCVLIWLVLLMMGSDGVCSLGGQGESLCLYKYALGSHSETEKFHMRMFMTPLQPNEPEATAGQRGCYGDQWCQRRATSVWCLSKQISPSLSLSSFSLVVSYLDNINADSLKTFF